MLRMLHDMTGRGRLQYGLLDDENRVIRWLDYPPANGRYITRRVLTPARAVPTIETYGAARW
jgi:hypothetical protein